MAQKKANIVTTIDIAELLNAASMVINNLIPQTVDKPKIHYELHVANKVDNEWHVGIPKTNKVKNIENTIRNLISINHPAAIMLIIYKTETDEYTRYSLKLDKGYVPVTDQAKKEVQESGKVVETPSEFEGLGALQNVMFDNLKKDNAIENLKIAHKNEVELLILRHEAEKKELSSKNHELTKQLDELKTDFQVVLEELDNVSSELEEKDSEFTGIKKTGMQMLMGLIAKEAMGDDFDLSGFMNNNEEKKETKKIEPDSNDNDVEVEYTEVNKNEKQNDPVTAIAAFLKDIKDEELLFRIIIILQNIAVKNELAERIIDLLDLSPVTNEDVQT